MAIQVQAVQAYTSVVTTAWVVVGTGAGTEVVGTGTDEIGVSGEFAVELDSGVVILLKIVVE